MTGAGHATGATYPGNAETFIVETPRHASVAGRAYCLSWRECEPWERPVVDRAYLRLAAWDAATVQVAARC